MLHPDDVGGALHDALGEKPARGEVEVVAGRAHRDGERLGADADLERLLHADVVLAAFRHGVDSDDRNASDGGSARFHLAQDTPVRKASSSHPGPFVAEILPPPAEANLLEFRVAMKASGRVCLHREAFGPEGFIPDPCRERQRRERV